MAAKSTSVQAAVKGALDASQRHKVATAIVETSDDRGRVFAMLDSIGEIVSKKGLRGKQLPDTDVDLIGDDAEKQYAAKGLDKDSIKVMKSDVRKLARNAPILVTIEDRTPFKSLMAVKRFCTVLQKQPDKGETEADVKAAIKAFTADPVRTNKGLTKSIGIHIRAVLGMTAEPTSKTDPKPRALSPQAKAALYLWAEKAGIEGLSDHAGFEDADGAKKFLGL